MKPSLFAGALLAIAATASAEDAKEQKAVQGKWVIVAATNDGKEIPKESLGKAAITFEGDVMTMTEEERKKTAKFNLDAAKTPAHIDFVPQEGGEKDKTIKGIYEVKGDTLRLCFSRPEKDRPAAFTSKEGDSLVLVELKRDKK